MTFESALDFVLAREGGYVNDPKDPGGETNMGISRKAYPDEDIAGMTRGRAAFLYRRDYWTPLCCDKLWPALALVTFDCAVNQGPRTAAKMLQHSVGVSPDGIIGPRTLSMARVTQPASAVNCFLELREARYRELPGFARFGKGWLHRLDDLHAAANELLETR